MKRNLVLLSLVAVLTVMASFAFAGAGVIMRIHVPFDFYMEDQLLQAGDYSFELGSGHAGITSMVTVRDRDGMGVRMLMTPAGFYTDADLSSLRFNQYGDKYFLSCVSVRGYNANVKMFKLERELRSQAPKTKATTLIAQK